MMKDTPISSAENMTRTMPKGNPHPESSSRLSGRPRGYWSLLRKRMKSQNRMRGRQMLRRHAWGMGGMEARPE